MIQNGEIDIVADTDKDNLTYFVHHQSYTLTQTCNDFVNCDYDNEMVMKISNAVEMMKVMKKIPL